MEILIGWLVFSVLAAWIASSKGRSGAGVFLLSIILSPLVGIIVALVLQRIEPASPDAPTPETHVKCPDCRELVLRDARICKHCGCKLIPQ